MDGNVAVQRATAWWESFGSDSARRAPEALAGLLNDLTAALDDLPDKQQRAADLLSGLTGVVQTRAHEVFDLAPAQVQSVAQELSSLAKSNSESLVRVAAILKAKVSDGAPADRFRVVFDHAAVAIAVATGEVESKIIDVNPAFAEMFNRAADVLRGKPITAFTNVEKLADEVDDWIRLVKSDGGTRRFEVRYRRADGELGWALFIVTYVPQSAREHSYVLAVAEDVTDQRSRADQLQWQANHDPLTGLPNRRYLQEELAAAIDRSNDGEIAGLCFIDLDNFKRVNDSYGHTVGDQILCVIAERLAAAAGQSGHEVIRLGGDEFVVLAAPPASKDDVVGVAKRLVSVLEAPIEVGDNEVHVRASIGVDLVDLTGADPATVLDGADHALYRTKAEGLGIVVFER